MGRATASASPTHAPNAAIGSCTMRKHLEPLFYRTLSRIAEVLPTSAVGPVCWVASKFGAFFLNEKRTRVAYHLAKITGQPASLRDIENAFGFYARYWLDAFRLPVEPKSHLLSSVEVVGRRHFESAVTQGKGVIVALPHIGNWDVAAAWCTASGFPLTAVAEQLEPPKLATWFADFRASIGVSTVVNGPNVANELLAALRRGECIALVCDRDVDGSGIDVEFFGEATKVPIGPAMLSLRSGAPILPVACYARRSGRHELVVEPPIELKRRGSFRDDVRDGTMRVVAAMEQFIRRDPSQWHVFVPNWPSESAM